MEVPGHVDIYCIQSSCLHRIPLFTEKEYIKVEAVNLTCVAGSKIPLPGSSDTQRECSGSVQHASELGISHRYVWHLPQRNGGHQRSQRILFLSSLPLLPPCSSHLSTPNKQHCIAGAGLPESYDER